jgi:hypothetical protein
MPGIPVIKRTFAFSCRPLDIIACPSAFCGSMLPRNAPCQWRECLTRIPVTNLTSINARHRWLSELSIGIALVAASSSGKGRYVPWYRVKLAVKVAGDPATSQRRREAVRALIGKSGGKDASPARPGTKFVAAVFTRADAVKAFRDRVRQTLRAS